MQPENVVLANYEFAHERIDMPIVIDGIRFEHHFRRPGVVDEKNKEAALKMATFTKKQKDNTVRTMADTRMTGGLIAYWNSTAHSVTGYQFKEGDAEDVNYAVTDRIDPGDGALEKDWPTVKDLVPATDKIKAVRKIYNGLFSVAEDAGTKRTRSVRIGRLTAVKWEPYTGEEDEEAKAMEKEARDTEDEFKDFGSTATLPSDEDDKPGVFFLYGEPDARQLKMLEKMTTGSVYEKEGGEMQEIVTDIDTILKLRPLLKEVRGGLVHGETWDSTREDHREAIPVALYKTTLILFWVDYKKLLGNS